MSESKQSRWRVVGPDGEATEFTADFEGACDAHDQFACIMAACPDAFGWRATNLDDGTEYVPEEIEERMLAGLKGQRPS
ncbi:hypothetical protein [Sanguibacter suaedae]|uniref:Uncharacterized protein n=1 Tax=Sanguibacter suaedae TaxID=2795737 RepID=A0A934I911_9MICO|nr:hypothetical protein [Sanguibacter suaedae]MBI9113616.1 hypothetical protein [Sanguibacter suaedae]